MTDRITYVKKEERVIVDTHLLAMATCIWPGCTHYKAQDFQLCADHIRSAAIFHQQQTPRPNIPIEVKQRIRAKQEEDLALYTAGQPLKHSTGSVYVLRSDDMIKIGYSETPRVRLKHYSPGAQVLVIFPGNLLIEKHNHHEFRHPVILGDDGRVWDGHHRICLAIKHGVSTLNVIRMDQ